MKAIAYTQCGGSEVLKPTERPIPVPGTGEVRVEVKVSGVNPMDWQTREEITPDGEQVPGQDGAGIIDGVGPDVDPARIGERVWLWEAAWERADGTAQEFLLLPAHQAVALGDAPFDLGGSLGVPAMTAHQCLALALRGPSRLTAGALLVAGGAGALGNAAVQLARWAGARVITKVSSADKARLALAASAHHVIDYRSEEPVAAIRSLAPAGVDLVIEGAPTANMALDLSVLAEGGTIACYNFEESPDVSVSAWELMRRNAYLVGVLVYALPLRAKLDAVAAICDALADDALRGGEGAGLPWHHFPLDQAREAHDAVQSGRTVGKALIDVTR
ncbi:NADPH:quinone reductase [Streptomyces spororaveus]|uniref:NADPH:quinone reductase n=1 Tax=Streptomyces spororaveus TaxID=284039 RepID=A0ABQ3T6V0_9ACTN|nr:NADPH:quinone reductase [Streptomyces spororaveus]GHI76121.1 NADPH:quinone reductase [Streptomyces spororaveus]